MKIVQPQAVPKAIETGRELKTVKIAYPPEKKAIIEVKTTVVPIDSYLYLSVKQISRAKIS